MDHPDGKVLNIVKIPNTFHRYRPMHWLILFFLALSCGISVEENPVAPDPFIALRAKAKEAKEFCKKNSYNMDFCLLADMSIHSGKKRIVLWDLKKDSIVYASLCSHGCGEAPWGSDYTKSNPVFSNKEGSHCTSLGKFRIGKRGYSAWGINVNYLLHGLDSTNNHALAREIVLHSWEMVAEEETYPTGAPEGWGCPAVSNNFLKSIDEKLKGSPTPVLFWAFK